VGSIDIPLKKGILTFHAPRLRHAIRYSLMHAPPVRASESAGGCILTDTSNRSPGSVSQTVGRVGVGIPASAGMTALSYLTFHNNPISIKKPIQLIMGRVRKPKSCMCIVAQEGPWPQTPMLCIAGMCCSKV